MTTLYLAATNIGLAAIVSSALIAVAARVDPQTRVEDAFKAGPFRGAK